LPDIDQRVGIFGDDVAVVGIEGKRVRVFGERFVELFLIELALPSSAKPRASKLSMAVARRAREMAASKDSSGADDQA
jgi:hypothetical protein